ncbi:MAG: peptidylprolyl isomerase [Clostridiales Family XIII bacterium]|jgi:peptidyl-prolyl cis-trans isomerase B (cyclophilin B)|nr:peptidylprolyl isomerase [Clostridiales Family XIII bacterium]
MKHTINQVKPSRIFAVIALAALIAMVAVLAGCGSSGSGAGSGNDSDKKQEEKNVPTEKPVVEITMQDGGKISVELEPAAAPKTVENFLKLVNAGFYDGLTFHRSVPGFMIQGGDPNGNGTGGSDENIEGEFDSNGFSNPISHERGVISMARALDKNSASSQFFIMLGDTPSLDGDYASFGRVTEGMEVVDKIAEGETTGPMNDTLVTPPVIASIKQVK